LDLQQSLIPMPLIEHLAGIMPRNESDEGYDYERFLQSLVSDSGAHISIVENRENQVVLNGEKKNGEQKSVHYL
jgi:hypothetical protein